MKFRTTSRRYFNYISTLFQCQMPAGTVVTIIEKEMRWLIYRRSHKIISIIQNHVDNYVHYLVKYWYWISPFTRCTNMPCNLIISNNGTRVYVTVFIVLYHVNHNAYFCKVNNVNMVLKLSSLKFWLYVSNLNTACIEYIITQPHEKIPLCKSRSTLYFHSVYTAKSGQRKNLQTSIFD